MGSCIPEAPYGIKALNEPFIVIPILPIIQGIEPHKVTKGEDFNQIPNRINFHFPAFPQDPCTWNSSNFSLMEIFLRWNFQKRTFRQFDSHPQPEFELTSRISCTFRKCSISKVACKISLRKRISKVESSMR